MLAGDELEQFLDEFFQAGDSGPKVGANEKELFRKKPRILQKVPRMNRAEKSLQNDMETIETGNREAEDESSMAEYTLPSDGLIIRQMKRQGKVSRRTWFAFALMLLVVPVLLFLSVKIWGGRKYLLCSLIVVVAAMLPFFLMFEGRKPKAREIMVISVLAAIGVAGRAAFFMVPSFKPVAAIVILSGISFGGEAGFLVGSLTMLVSNMFMGQGPWTPWQMFAFGIIGFLAGILYQKGILKARKTDLCIYGFLSVFLIYGGIMNPASILMSYGYITKSSLIAYYISGAPVDLVHAASTVVFLIFLSRPLLEKLERIKVKYGLLQE